MTNIKKFQWTVLLVSLLGFLFLFSPPAYAGAGAMVEACIYLPTKPANPLQFDISAGGSGTICMGSVGKNTQISVTSAGVTCNSVGYVEEETCVTRDSRWVLAYSVEGTPFSGSTKSYWYHPWFQDNHIILKDYTKGTNVCTTPHLCSATEQYWASETQGPIYIIFQPTVQ